MVDNYRLETTTSIAAGIPDKTYPFDEVWKPVIGRVEGFPYEVSNWGRVRLTKSFHPKKNGMILKFRQSHDGYYYLKLSKEDVSIYSKTHILVAEAFLGIRPEGMVVAHKDDDKRNNTPDNFEYITKVENTKDAGKRNLMSHGDTHHSSKLTADQVMDIKCLIRLGLTDLEIAKGYCVEGPAIYSIRLGKTWKHIQFGDKLQ